MPDLIFFNAKLWTQDPRFPNATAVSLRDGKILAVGGDDEILASAPRHARIIDLRGRRVLPGLTDAHGHLMGLAATLLVVDLTDARSEREVVQRVVRRVAETPSPGWIQGRGWDQNLWPERTMPDHRLLSERVPDRPVALWRVDGHALWSTAGRWRSPESTRRRPIRREAAFSVTHPAVRRAF